MSLASDPSLREISESKTQDPSKVWDLFICGPQPLTSQSYRECRTHWHREKPYALRACAYRRPLHRLGFASLAWLFFGCAESHTGLMVSEDLSIHTHFRLRLQPLPDALLILGRGLPGADGHFSLCILAGAHG